MNNVGLVGRISKELECRYTQTQKAVCEFSLAVNRIGEGTDFIPCVVWGKPAENLAKYQGKGSQIAVSGEIRVDKYQTNTGENRYKTYVLCSTIEYLGTKKEENAQNNQNIVQNEVKSDPFAEFGEEIEQIQHEKMELPF